MEERAWSEILMKLVDWEPKNPVVRVLKWAVELAALAIVGLLIIAFLQQFR